MKRSMCLMTLAVGLAAAMSGCGPTTMSPGSSGFDRTAADGDDAKYTVLLKVFHGIDHQQMATLFRDRLADELRWRGLKVVAAGGHSELYWGSFDSIKAAQPTLKRARRHRAATGIAPFAGATITLAPGAGGKAAGEWDIRNCPGAYSLLVAVFEDQPKAKPRYVGRRKFAAAYCEKLRGEGHEAYVHHGPRSSSVTIGSFQRDAIEVRKRRVRVTGSPRPGYVEETIPVDPALVALMKEFPARAWNGREYYDVQRDAAGKEISRKLAPSVPIEVPRGANQEQPNRANDRPGNRQPW